VVGPVYLRAFDPLGFLVWESTADTRQDLRVYPREEALRRVLSARDTQLSSGDEVSRRKGEGIEFADLRRWAPGDPVRRVNWRASARRGELWMNESHPERNIDVILFVDAFAEARLGADSTLDLAARATAALADAYVGRRDRVRLLSLGGILRWLAPELGTTQLYRVVDALLDTQIVLSYYWKEIDVIPRRTLPPNALVIALSPLLDPRSVGALLDLRARGHDLAVIDVSPIPFTTRPESGIDAIAYDIWALRRDALRHTLERSGVAVAEWHAGSRLQAVLEEVTASGQWASRASDDGNRLAGRPGGGRHRRSCTAAPRRSPRGPSCGRRLVLLFGVARRRPVAIPWSVLLTAAAYLVGREGNPVVDGGAAIVGALLLLSAELASWSIGHDARIETERRLVLWRAGVIGALVGGALLVDFVLLGAAAVSASAGVVVAAAGVVAAVAAVAIVLRLVRA
jgi:hypothetical protein